MKPKIIISASGTGGHLIPAQALAKQLKEKKYQVCFAAGKLANNSYFDKKQFAFYEIACGSIAVKNPLQLLRSFLKISKGFIQSLLFLKRQRPCLVVAFGSYHTFPLLLGTLLLRIPYILHEANAKVGVVNRLFSRFAKVTGVQFPKATSQLKGRSVYATLPLRPEFSKPVSKEKARDYFGLEQRPTLLVFGGSQGAMALNEKVVQALALIPEDKRIFQVIHLLGKNSNVSHFESVYKTLGLIAVVKEFETQMIYAWCLADLAIARSGASTVAEMLAMHVPTLFIPFPFATDDHQTLNAHFVVDEVKGGWLRPQADLDLASMAREIQNLFAPSSTELNIFKNNIEAFEKNHHMDLRQLIEKEIGIYG